MKRADVLSNVVMTTAMILSACAPTEAVKFDEQIVDYIALERDQLGYVNNILYSLDMLSTCADSKLAELCREISRILNIDEEIMPPMLQARSINDACGPNSAGFVTTGCAKPPDLLKGKALKEFGQGVVITAEGRDWIYAHEAMHILASRQMGVTKDPEMGDICVNIPGGMFYMKSEGEVYANYAIEEFLIRIRMLYFLTNIYLENRGESSPGIDRETEIEQLFNHLIEFEKAVSEGRIEFESLSEAESSLYLELDTFLTMFEEDLSKKYFREIVENVVDTEVPFGEAHYIRSSGKQSSAINMELLALELMKYLRHNGVNPEGMSTTRILKTAIEIIEIDNYGGMRKIDGGKLSPLQVERIYTPLCQ